MWSSKLSQCIYIHAWSCTSACDQNHQHDSRFGQHGAYFMFASIHETSEKNPFCKVPSNAPSDMCSDHAQHVLSGESSQNAVTMADLIKLARFLVNVVSQWFTQSSPGDLEGFSPSQKSAITHQAMGWTEIFLPLLQKLGCLTKTEFKNHWITRKRKTEGIFFLNSFLTPNYLQIINS